MLRLMNVHAHPDDESSKGAATSAMYVAEGVDVHVVTCTGGERGSILNPNMDRPDVLANMSSIRKQEMGRGRGRSWAPRGPGSASSPREGGGPTPRPHGRGGASGSSIRPGGRSRSSG